MPSTPDRLVLVRHGESARNAAKAGQIYLPAENRDAFLGQSDQATELTDLGWEQAWRTGLALRERFGTFDLVYHSGYRRTIETTSAILEAWPEAERTAMNVREHLLLRERDTGYTVNMTSAEASAAFPWFQSDWTTTGHYICRPPGGESMADVAQRAMLFLHSMADTLANKRVLLVTHAGTTRMFRSVIEGWSHEEAMRQMTHATANGGIVSYQTDALTDRLAVEA